MAWSWFDISCSMLLAVSIAGFVFHQVRRSASFPPGPSRWSSKSPPLKINPKMTEQEALWVWNHAQAVRYGPLVHTTQLGVHTIVIDDYATAEEMLSQRAPIYSSRPRMMMVAELAGHSNSIGMSPYGPVWKERRRLLSQNLAKGASQDLLHYIRPSCERMVQSTANEPDAFVAHLRLAIASNILRIGYGIKVESAKDPFVEAGETCFRETLLVGFGRFYVDYFPILRYLPRSFNFHKKAQGMRENLLVMINRPYEHVLKMMGSGQPYEASMASLLISEGHDPEDIKRSCGSLYIAGTETTRASVLSFCFAMLVNPDVQDKVYNELDKLLGLSTVDARLPSLDDHEKLPYFSAALKEALRWHVPSHQLLPHSNIRDDVYKGKLIPKGSVIQANLWAMSQDERHYPSPEAYDPSRFLGEGDRHQLDPTSYLFGFGRRSCPAQHFAEQVVFLYTASLVACFKIENGLDSLGREIKPDKSCWRVSSALDFKCRFTPRNKHIAEMIQSLDVSDFAA